MSCAIDLHGLVPNAIRDYAAWRPEPGWRSPAGPMERASGVPDLGVSAFEGLAGLVPANSPGFTAGRQLD
jgi:hypothetical protein